VADVVTVSLVLATPLFGVTVVGLKLQVIPVRQDRKSDWIREAPADVTATLNKTDWPAVTWRSAELRQGQKSC